MRVKVYNNRFRVFNTRAKYNYPNESKAYVDVIQADVALTADQRLYAHFMIGIDINELIWVLRKAYYLMLGGTASTHKWNAKDLRDLDAAFRLTFTGGVTHSSNGVQFNGSTGYANTFLVPSIVLSNTSTYLYAYIKSSSTSTSTTTPYVMGAINYPLTGNNFGLTDRHNGTSNLKLFTSSNPTSNDQSFESTSATPFLRSYSGNLLNGIISLWSNGVEITTTKSSTGQSTLSGSNLIIGASNLDVSIDLFDNKLLSVVSISQGLTDSQIMIDHSKNNFGQKILNRA